MALLFSQGFIMSVLYKTKKTEKFYSQEKNLSLHDPCRRISGYGNYLTGTHATVAWRLKCLSETLGTRDRGSMTAIVSSSFGLQLR